jgi:hypothetical protein
VDVTEGFRASMARSLSHRRRADGTQPFQVPAPRPRPESTSPRVQHPQHLPTPQVAPRPAVERKPPPAPRLAAAK